MSGAALAPGLAASDAIELYRLMALIRAFDSTLPGLYTKGLVRGSSHAAIGQEAVAVGACAALEDADFVTSTHRGHGHRIAKGADVRRMMAELLGREAGYCRGKGGSMHIADFSQGHARRERDRRRRDRARRRRGARRRSCAASGQVALCFFGEGAINQGAFLGVANMAAIWKLPLVLRLREQPLRDVRPSRSA